jgi:hypothetical protein
MENLPTDVWMQYILPFVGKDQFRFVASVNRKMYRLYTTVFTEKTTRYNVSTLELAQMCCSDLLRVDMGHLIRAKLCRIAARQGNLEIIDYVFSMTPHRDTAICAAAAEEGHLHVLKWLRDSSNCPWHAHTSAMAAENGHSQSLQWAQGNCCPWNEETCANAAANGHLEILQWARANGCP